MSNKGDKIIKYALSFALAAIFVLLAFRGLDWSAFADGLRHTRWAFVALFTFASTAALVFRMLRWKALIEPIDPFVRKLTVWDANNVSNVANIALPGSGEFIRCGYLAGRNAPFGSLFGTIILERICDVAAVIVLFILALVAGWGRFGTFFTQQVWTPLADRMDVSIWLIPVAAVTVLAAVVLLVFRMSGRSRFCGRVAGVIRRLGEGFASIGSMDRKWLFLAYTTGIWAMYILMSYSIILALPDLNGLNLLDALFISAIGNIASVIPVPGGIGAYHYLIALCLSSLYGASWEYGILYATLCHELHAIIIIILGIVSYIGLTIRKRK